MMESTAPVGNSAAAPEMVPLATLVALQAEMEELRAENAALKASAAPAAAPNAPSSHAGDDEISKAFDAVDEDGNGVLDLEEFRKGYALLNGDAVARVFEAIDDNGDGVLTKEEFRKGFVLLTSDSMLAKVERAKVEAAVEAARVAAVKQAAINLAEAQLMFQLAIPGVCERGQSTSPVARARE